MSWNSPPPIHEHEDERALKMEYARLWAKDPSRIDSIGYDVFPGQENYGRAMQARIWRHDPDVLAEYERLASGGLIDEEEEDAKTIILRKLDKFQRNVDDDKLRLEAIKIEAEVRGVIGKGSVNINVDNSKKTQNVLMVPSYTLAEFRQQFKEQQTRAVAEVKGLPSNAA